MNSNGNENIVDCFDDKPVGYERNMIIQGIPIHQRHGEVLGRFYGLSLDMTGIPSPSSARAQDTSPQETRAQGTTNSTDEQPFWQTAFEQWNRTHAPSAPETLAPLQLGLFYNYVIASFDEVPYQYCKLQFELAVGMSLRVLDSSVQRIFRWNQLEGAAISHNQLSVALYKRSDTRHEDLRQVAHFHCHGLPRPRKSFLKKFLNDLRKNSILERNPSGSFRVQGTNHSFHRFIK